MTHEIIKMSILSKISLSLINFYQSYISPYTPPSCRFEPSCSNYAKQAFMKYGYFKAFYLSVKRIIKCNPFNKGGYDPLL